MAVTWLASTDMKLPTPAGTRVDIFAFTVLRERQSDSDNLSHLVPWQQVMAAQHVLVQSYPRSAWTSTHTWI